MSIAGQSVITLILGALIGMYLIPVVRARLGV